MQLQDYIEKRPEIYETLFNYMMKLEADKPEDIRKFGTDFIGNGPRKSKEFVPPRTNFERIR